MSEASNLFIELHVLRSFAPGNLNRDELGTPKTAMFGGERRLRLSSQCVKRTWRTDERYFARTLVDPEATKEQQDAAAARVLSQRTALLPEQFAEALKANGLSESEVSDALEVVSMIGKKSKKDDAESAEAAGEDDGEGDGDASDEADDEAAVGARKTKHLLFLSKGDRDALLEYFLKNRAEVAKLFVEKKGKGSKAPKVRALDPKAHEKFRKELAKHMEDRWTGVDIALFGRFVTSPELPTVGAALQVAHALGTQKVEVEYDYFSAVDDVAETTGAGHIGESEFAASVLYQYASCDWGLLCKNLHGDEALAARSLKAVVAAAARSVPKGKVNGTAPHNPADYVEVVVRRSAPISLANAFLKPVRPRGDADVMDVSIKALREHAARYAGCYDEDGDVVARIALSTREVDANTDGVTFAGSLNELGAKLAATLATAEA